MTVGKRDCASPLMRRKAACRLNAHRSFFMTVGIIRLAVMMYVRFPLSLRQVKDLLHEHGIDICYEAVSFAN